MAGEADLGMSLMPGTAAGQQEAAQQNVDAGAGALAELTERAAEAQSKMINIAVAVAGRGC